MLCSLFGFSFIWFWLFLSLSWLPLASASPASTPFPKVTFQAFSDFILSTFNPDINLSTALLIFFSILSNPELLNLHARQQHPRGNERKISISSWMKVFGKALQDRMDSRFEVELFQTEEYKPTTAIKTVASKLHKFVDFLGLSPYRHGQLKGKIHQISQTPIHPIRFICPPNMSCTSHGCHHHRISLANRFDEIPIVTLIEGFTMIKKVYLVTDMFLFVYNFYLLY